MLTPRSHDQAMLGSRGTTLQEDFSRTGSVWVGHAQNVVVALAGAYLIALSAQVRLAVPFSPVPITLQTLAVLLVGALLGTRRGVASVVIYLAAGAVGMPFFAGGALAGPTGGYLVGFAVAAYVTGLFVADGWGRRPLTALTALLVGNLAIYLIGLPWLATFVGWQAALPLGLFPFVAGDVAKLVCATGVVLLRCRHGAPHSV